MLQSLRVLPQGTLGLSRRAAATMARPKTPLEDYQTPAHFSQLPLPLHMHMRSEWQDAELSQRLAPATALSDDPSLVLFRGSLPVWGTEGEGEDQGSEEGQPKETPEEKKRRLLIATRNILLADLPNMFIRPQRVQVYHPKIVFENRIHGKVVEGLAQYYLECQKLRIMGNLKYTTAKFRVLTADIDPDSNLVRIHWRISGIRGFTALTLMFRKLTVASDDEFERIAHRWMEGISEFHVGADGRIHRHVADNKDVDREGEGSQDGGRKAVEKIKEKLGKLKGEDTVPAPV